METEFFRKIVDFALLSGRSARGKFESSQETTFSGDFWDDMDMEPPPTLRIKKLLGVLEISSKMELWGGCIWEGVCEPF